MASDFGWKLDDIKNSVADVAKVLEEHTRQLAAIRQAAEKGANAAAVAADEARLAREAASAVSPQPISPLAKAEVKEKSKEEVKQR